MPKVECPVCGSSTSSVYKSRPAVSQGDGFRRRRVCGECGFGRAVSWWTIELTDWPALERLALQRNLTIEQLLNSQKPAPKGRLV